MTLTMEVVMRRLVLALGLLLLGAATAAGHATDPAELLGSGAVVHACLSSRGGMVQVVDPATGVCAFGGTPLHWPLVAPPAPVVLAGGSCGPVFQAGMTVTRVTRPGSCSDEPTPLPLPFTGVLTDLRARLPAPMPLGVVADIVVAIDGALTSLRCGFVSSTGLACEHLGEPLPVTAGTGLTVHVIVEDVIGQASGAADVVYSLVLVPGAP